MTSQSNTITSQAQDMTTQVNREVEPRVPQHGSTMASHLRDFTRMNPPMFFGSISNEDPQDFLHKVYKIIYAIMVTSIDKDELVAYQLKDVVKNLYVKWRNNRALRGGPVTWEIFKRAFLDQFYHIRGAHPRRNRRPHPHRLLRLAS